MFDVSWTDPTQETVGQRKARKDQQATGLSRGSSLRSSRSNESTRAHARPSLMNLFASNGKNTPPRTGSHSKLSALRTEEAKQSTQTVLSYTSDRGSQGQLETLQTVRNPVNNFLPGGPYHSDAEQSCPSEVSESVFSGWTGRSTNTESTWSSIQPPISQGKVVQPLSPTSFVTQSTEITVSPRDSVQDAEQVATMVRISSSGTTPLQLKDLETTRPEMSPNFEFPIPSSQISKSPESIPVAALEQAEYTSNTRPIAIRHRQADSWRPPDAWECPTEESETDIKPEQVLISAPKLVGPPFRLLKETRQKPTSMELSHLQRNIRRMEAASPKIILERLKEEWLEVADASVYRELEIEKQLWMLTALQGLRRKTSTDSSDAPSRSATAVTQMLSLYENQASSSYLSALNPLPKIHHISTNPLSAASYPNIQPLAVITPKASLPYRSNTFSSIHAFALPTILPAASIPLILRECHRTLISSSTFQPTHHTLLPSTPPVYFSSTSSLSSEVTVVPAKSRPSVTAGVLHLTILDPAPLPDTLGPRLRAWLDSHLMLNLERRFRCINPGRLFPIWLADAGLRAEGSTIVTARFLACVNNAAHGLDVEASFFEGHGVKQQLKSVVGRMLWKEMWGAFVEGERWWWEDEAIVDECERLGTCWEYVIIEAVKQG